MNSVELFVGGGGLGIGLSRAGFTAAKVIEWDHDACEAIRENQRQKIDPVVHWPLEEMDVRNFDYSSIDSEIVLVAGGPPCQPFSLGGKHRGYRDERDMFPQAVRAVRELRPKAILFENVKGLTRQTFARYFSFIKLQLKYPKKGRDEGETWLEHCQRLEKLEALGASADLKYSIHTKLLNAADYGVPQRRERVFIVGFRSDIEVMWQFPRPTHSQNALLWAQWVTGEYWDSHGISKRRRPAVPLKFKKRVELLRWSGLKPTELPWLTVRDAIADLPDSRVASDINIQGNHRFIPGARIYAGHTGSPLDEPAKTLKAGGHGVPGGENMVALPNGTVRYFTVRESARLQTFPDRYIFSRSWTESMRQLGNAVPTKLAEAVAAEIRNELVKKRPLEQISARRRTDLQPTR